MTAGPPLPQPVDSSADQLAHAYDLAEALVIADAVGDHDRADRLLAELKGLAATTPPVQPRPPILAAIRQLGAVGDTRLTGPLAGLIPGPARAAHDLGLHPNVAADPGNVLDVDGRRWHELKVWPAFWTALASGAKTFEIRRDDGRGYQVGDLLNLAEYDPDRGTYTGRTVTRAITYAATAEDLAAIGLHYLAAGTVVLGLGPADRPPG